MGAKNNGSNMIRFKQLHLRRGTKVLFDEVDLTLNPREKIGLVGSNGSGKSSLFAMLRNELHCDLGSVEFPTQWRLAYVLQETPALNRSALDYVMDGDKLLRTLQARLAELESADASDDNGNAIAEVYMALADADAYTAQSRAEQLLLGLGFSMEQMTQSVASFSGGWRMRLNLAQALMCPSDLLLLDEPTNHLDLDAIIWLEDWLGRYTGTLMVISHDRDFLDGVTNVIVHIDHCKLKRYSGNYSSFEQQRLAQLELTQALVEKQTRQRAHLQSYIDRFRYKTSKAKQAQSRIKMLARMEEVAPLRAAAEFSFEFKEPLSAPNPLLVMEDVDAGYHSPHNKVIVSAINFSLQIGQRIGLLGVNGAGKSTLIKTIAGELKPLSGVAHLGKGLTIGYFAQHQLEMLRDDESPLWHLMKLSPTTREQELRNFLGSFNFPGPMATSSIRPFSGGEKARLALALIVWQRPNLLLLDEPTNHLDLETREALTDALAQFEGTVVLVSHDRHLLRACTDQFMIVAEGKLKPFDGDLDDYKTWLLQHKLATNESPKKVLAKSTEANTEANIKKVSASSNHNKTIEKKIAKLDEQINQWASELSRIADQLNDQRLYEGSAKEKLAALLQLQATVHKNLNMAEGEWLSLHEELSRTFALKK
jgi:ATP-binding cassette subfamily F protein 3